MRYAIFSDVHANRQAWEAVRGDMLRQGVGTLICLGDVVGYGPKPLEVLTSVRQSTPNFLLGNHDAAACGRLDASIFNARARAVIEWTSGCLDEESMAFLNQVPLQLDGEKILFVHAEVTEPGEFGYVNGLGPAETNLRAMKQPLAFIGHTHLPLAYSMPKKGGPVMQLPPIDFQVERGKRTLVNVGSVGEPRTTDVRASYVIYDDVERTVSFRKVAFDVHAYMRDLEEVGLNIRPYFVQVVDAGMVAGAPAPTAAPQFAMVELPKVVEGVAGHHAELVVGNPGGGAAWGRGAATPALAEQAPAPVKQPKTVSIGVIVVCIALIAVCIGGVVVLAKRNGNEAVAANEQAAKPKEGSKKEQAPAPKAEPAPAEPEPIDEPAPTVESSGPIKDLKAKLFVRSIESLEKLRELAASEAPDEEVKVVDGLVTIAPGKDNKSYGLVWEGYLKAPEGGDYAFKLDCDNGAALFLYHKKELEISNRGAMGRPKTATVKLGKTPAPFRLEYFQNGGNEGLELTWSGPGFDAPVVMVGDGPGTAMPVVANTPKTQPPNGNKPPAPKPDPKPAPNTKPVDILSQDLLSYWSFDRNAGAQITGGNDRIVKHRDGSIRETLVSEKNQRVHAFVPKSNIGVKWRNLDFDDSGWKKGQNGVGYEDKPADYKDLIKTKAGGTPRKNPHSIYVRIPFEIDDPDAYAGLALYMKYEDGFAAFLNGFEMTKKNAPHPLMWNSAASNQNDDKKAVKPELFKVNSSLVDLRPGRNILAIQGLNIGGTPNNTNTGSSSSDILVLPTLIALRKDNANPAPSEEPKRPSRDLEVAKGQIKGTVETTSGKFGDAYDFKTGSIEIGEKDKYSIGDHSFSVSLWFSRHKKSTDNQARRLISAGAGDAKKSGWALSLNRAVDTLVFELSDGMKHPATSKKVGGLANGQWHHVVATVDWSSGIVQLYFDGKPIADQRVDFVGKSTIPSQSGLSIGRNSDDKQHHRGKLDEVAIWRRTLAPEEVARIYKGGKSLGAIFDGE